MEDISDLVARVSQELDPHASDEEISEKVRETIEALPESDRTQVLEQLVKGISSRQIRHLDKVADVDSPNADAPGLEDTP
jgi:hypothetical protein